MRLFALFAILTFGPVVTFGQVTNTPTFTIPPDLVIPLKAYLLTAAERPGVLVADRNGDGVITDAELATWMEATARRAIRDHAGAAATWAQRRSPALLPQAVRDADQAVRDAQTVLDAELAKLRESGQ